MGTEHVAVLIAQAARIIAIATFVFSLTIGLSHWAIRRGSIAAFGGWAKLTRRVGDPILKPVERRVLRAGGNPQDAPGWLIAGTVVAALIFIASIDWVLNFVLGITQTLRAGQGGTAILLADTVFRILQAALLIRVISSWLPISPYSRWMRPVYFLTDWIVRPISKVIPTVGMFDFSPVVALFLLYFLQSLVFRLLLQV